MPQIREFDFTDDRVKIYSPNGDVEERSNPNPLPVGGRGGAQLENWIHVKYTVYWRYCEYNINVWYINVCHAVLIITDKGC